MVRCRKVTGQNEIPGTPKREAIMTPDLKKKVGSRSLPEPQKRVGTEDHLEN